MPIKLQLIAYPHYEAAAAKQEWWGHEANDTRLPTVKGSLGTWR